MIDKKGILETLLSGHSLSRATSSQVFGAIMDGETDDIWLSGFLVALRAKGEAVNELVGAAAAMRARMLRLDVRRAPLVDTCGTGGDGAGTFNVSTVAAIVAAAAGVTIAKHGNRAVSSKSGSADLLAALGVRLDAPPEATARSIEQLGIGFMFAQNHHPAMRHAAPVRRALGLRTVFNLLGPMTNPAGATRQLLGVFSKAYLRPVCEALAQLGCERAWVVHSRDGLDELSVSAPTDVVALAGGEITEHVVEPGDFGLGPHARGALAGGDAMANAALARELLGGSLPGPLEDAVVLNAGAALLLGDGAENLREGVVAARGAIGSGAAGEKLARWAAAVQV